MYQEVPLLDLHRKLVGIRWFPYTSRKATCDMPMAESLCRHLERQGLGFQIRDARGNILREQHGMWFTRWNKLQNEGGKANAS